MTLLVCAELEKWIGDLESWRAAPLEIKQAFAKEMEDKEYGYDALFNAWIWFLTGWQATAQADGGLVANADGLLPCPFCGEPAREGPHPGGNGIQVGCVNDQCSVRPYRYGIAAHRQYIHREWNTRQAHTTDLVTRPDEIKNGDYVLCTKWSDGDPQDHWYVGFYDRFDGERHYVTDKDGNQARAGGFRRAARIQSERGEWLLKNSQTIQHSNISLWFWVATSMETFDEHGFMLYTPDDPSPEVKP